MTQKQNSDSAIFESIRFWFEGYVRHFVRDDETYQRNVETKLLHTQRVCNEIIDLAKSLGLGHEGIIFSETLALLHDIGRFEQYERYGTFSDRNSEDHAQLGIRILHEHRVLDRLDLRDRNLLYRCIANHNRMRIPDSENEEGRLYSSLLRDADKLDIWRVLTEYYADSNRQKNPTLELDMPESPEISDKVAGAVLGERIVDTRYVRTTADYIVLQMSWIYDVNFPCTFTLCNERKYLEKLAHSLPRGERTSGIYHTARSFLDAKLQREV